MVGGSYQIVDAAIWSVWEADWVIIVTFSLWIKKF